MKTTLVAAALLCALPTLAQVSPIEGQKILTTCWYNENGELTGSQPAAPNARPGTTVHAAASAEHTWSHTVSGGSAACPAKLPVSSALPP